MANKTFGTFKEVTVLRSFLFDWNEYVGGGNFGQVLDEWRLYLAKPGRLLIGYFYFFLVVVGLFLSLVKKREIGKALVPVWLGCLVFLINMNPPFDWVFNFLRDNFPLLKEGLRSPFTKFSLVLVFAEAVYVAMALEWVLIGVKRLSRRFFYFKGLVIGLGIIASLVIYMWPAFEGALISPSMKVKIPDGYFAMFAWFNEQPSDGRVACLPLNSLFGWAYHDWGQEPSYQGAGFIWFGIKQPVLNRDFDRWNPANEQNFRELSGAVYRRDKFELEKVLQKYRIRWLVLDETVIAPGEGAEGALFYPEIEELLASSENVRLVASFKPKIKIYEVDLKKSQGILKLRRAMPGYLWSWEDQAFLERGDYFESNDEDQGEGSYYPFRSDFQVRDTFWLPVYS